jgi:outer membrane autotransporter protein
MFATHARSGCKPAVSLLASVSVITIVVFGLGLGAVPAWADGGNGNGIGPGQGGVDGTLATASGGNGANGQASGGGGGGTDLITGNGAPGGSGGSASTAGDPNGAPAATGGAGQVISTSATISTSISGGTGATGSAGVSGTARGGGGGGGGVGVRATADLVVTGSGSVTGGAGGIAGANSTSAGGGGGVGVFSSANVTVAAGGSVTGGAGGRGLTANSGGGGGAAAIVLTGGGTIANSGNLVGGIGGRTIVAGGGDGGAGVLLLSGGTVINGAGATILGGTGGQGGAGVGGGDGGAGIKGANIAVINAGTITGGAAGAGGTPIAGKAIAFTGGVNSLEIQSGSAITGNVVAFSTADTFKLGGGTNATFDLSQFSAGGKYQGFGQFVKTGTGAWTLTGTTTAVTPWTLTGGILQISSDGNLGNAAGGLTFNGGALENTATISTARSMALAGNGTLLTDAGTTLTVSGLFSGAGALTKDGSGTLILTGVDTYSGGTTISSGTLQLGSGGTAGSVTGNVADNAVLVFNRSDAVGFGGVISGTGSLRQSGGGATTLSGVNTYAGGTIIGAGSLTGSATSFGSGAITDNAALVIDQPADATFANPIAGTGSFTKRGAGRLNYTGTGTLSGATTVAAGLLSVNGSLAGSAVAVQSGATLGGNGTVGTTTVQPGGTIAPGNSIGTLNITGNFTQSSGAIYQVEVDPNSNASDRILVSGAATLQSGAGLNVTKAVAGEYQPGTVYTVLTANGGLSGRYTVTGQTSGVSAFLGLRDSYDANNAYLTVVQTRDPVTAATTPNQVAVATAIDTLPVTNPVNTAVLNLPDDASARSAFDQFSAAAQASAKSALVSNALYLRDVSFDRLRDVLCTSPDQDRHVGCGSERLSFWGQGFGGWGGLSGNTNAAGLNHSMAGALVGVDVPVLDWRIGVFGGASHSDFHLVNGAAAGGSSDYHLGAYGGTHWDEISLRLGASYSWDGLSTDRTVTVGTLTNQLQAIYQGGTTQAFADLGYGFEESGIRFEPFANLAYVSLHTPAFSEAGGSAALNVQADTIDNAVTTLGVRPSTDVSFNGWNMTLRGMMGWRHTFGRVLPTATASFAGSNGFTVSGAPIARDTAAVEAGMDFGLYDNITAGLTYGGQFSNRSTDQIARGTIRIAL